MSIKVVEHHGDGKTLEQVREATAKLRADIKALCDGFYTQTGCRVSEIRTDSFQVRPADEPRYRRMITDINIEIDAGF